MEEWVEALEQLRTCLDELENALHMGDLQRVKQCRKWANEAEAHEKQAYSKAIAAMS